MAKPKTDYEVLLSHFDATPLLVVDGEAQTTELLTKKEFVERIAEEHRKKIVRSSTVVTIRESLVVFGEKITKQDFTFNVYQLAELADVPYTVMNHWITLGIVPIDADDSTKKERKATFRAAFIAALVGGLRRQNASLPILRSAANLVWSIGKKKAATASA